MIDVLIVEDHPLMRTAICATLETDREIMVKGAVGTYEELLSFLGRIQCDVVMLDLYLPGISGVDIICALRKEYPNVNILVFSSSTEANDIYRSLRSGASGYLTKNANSTEVLGAIHAVSQGKSFLPSTITDVLIDEIHQREEQPDIDLTEKLTRREYQIMTLLAEGLSNAQLSERMHISKETVRTHIYNMKKKLPVDNRSQLILFAVKQRSLKEW